MRKDNIRIVLVDDHPVVIQGLKTALAEEDSFTIADTFSSGLGLLTFLENNAIDVVLLDIILPDGNGVDFCLEIKRLYPDIVVLILSNHAERSFIMQAVQNGASGYLLKNTSLAELTTCIHEAIAGQVTFSDEVKKIMVRPVENDIKGIPQLTKREKEILKLLANGKTSATIADELHISPLTIITHRRNLMHKFDVKNVAELIMAATRNNYL